MESLWTFRCYMDERKRKLQESWYKGSSPEVRGKFLSRLKYLAARERKEWIRPYFDILSDEGKGLGEIRFKENRTEHRPLGFFSPGRVFTFVFFAIEKSGRFKPGSACSTGLTRKAEIEKKPARCHVCKIEMG